MKYAISVLENKLSEIYDIKNKDKNDLKSIEDLEIAINALIISNK